MIKNVYFIIKKGLYNTKIFKNCHMFTGIADFMRTF